MTSYDLPLINFFFGGGLYCMVYGILVSQKGIEPTAPTVEVLTLNHWTTREVPSLILYSHCFPFFSHLYIIFQLQ